MYFFIISSLTQNFATFYRAYSELFFLWGFLEQTHANFLNVDS